MGGDLNGSLWVPFLVPLLLIGLCLVLHVVERRLDRCVPDGGRDLMSPASTPADEVLRGPDYSPPGSLPRVAPGGA